MKKLIALLLAAFMLVGTLALVGCDKDNDPAGTPNSGNNSTDLYTLVTTALKKTTDATSYSGSIKQVVTENVMGHSTEVRADYTIKASLADPAKPLIGMEGNMVMSGETVPYVYYFDGEWMYYSMYGEGYKMQSSLEQFEKDAGGIDSLFTDLPKALFDGMTATTEGNTTKVTLTADSDTFKNMYTKLITDMFTDVLGENITPVVVTDVMIAVSVANGYVMGYDLSFVGTYTIGSDSISYSYSQAVNFDSVDKEVTVTPPEGYENFMELDWG